VVPLGSHDMFLADILAVYVEDSLLDEQGKLHLEKADLCAYAHGDYYALGKILGHFGFSATKKKKKRK
jgi:flavin reductase (DIM6/NTAB) family NADH-FMN oxidoreductase RutF